MWWTTCSPSSEAFSAGCSPKATALVAKIQTAIETKSGANIIQYANPPAVFAKALADVSDVAEALGSEGSGWLPAGPFQCVQDGKWIGVPLGQHNWFMNYRADWFKEEGADKFPDTWEDLLAVGKKLKAKGRLMGITFSDKAGGDGNAAPYLVLWAFGGKEFNPDGSLALDSKETIAALEYAIRFHNEAGDPGEVAYDDGANNAAFLAGKISMTPNVNTIYLPATKNNPELAKNMNHTIPPRGPAGRFGACTLPWWGILNHTKGADLDAAKDLIRQFFSIKNLSAFCKAGQGYILPMLPKYESEPTWRDRAHHTANSRARHHHRRHLLIYRLVERIALLDRVHERRPEQDADQRHRRRVCRGRLLLVGPADGGRDYRIAARRHPVLLLHRPLRERHHGGSDEGMSSQSLGVSSQTADAWRLATDGCEMSDFSSFKLVRLTAKIFHPGEYELGRYAAAGLPSIVQVYAEAPEAIAAQVCDADVVIVVGTPMPRRVIDAMRKARAIARMGTGTDKIDVARATELGILVANTPYFCIEEMADHVMALILALNRKLFAMQRSMVDGDLSRMDACTLGLIGFGRSAMLTAQRAKGFGMRVLATRRNKNAPRNEADALGVEMTDLDTVLRESDYISLHVPPTSETRHMIDDAALRKMKPTACIINTSRGLLIDERALIAALDEGRIAGAGLDTFGLIDIFAERIEPPVHPLSGRDNVILSPHVAAGSIQAKYDMFDAGTQNLIDILSGYWPLAENIVNPTVRPRYPFKRRVLSPES